MLKTNSSTLFAYGKEDHTEETAKELSEQGAISHADAEEVTAPVTPEADVTEAGDDIGQSTPKEEISPDDKADITQTESVDDAPLEGAGGQVAPEVASEMTELLQDGEQAQSAKDEIVQQATAEVAGGDAAEGGDGLDANGNAVTEEQAAANAEEDAVENETEDDAEEEAEAKDIHQEAAEADENSDEELSDAINDDTQSDDTASEATDSTDATEGDDAFGGTDAALGDETPLEGAETDGTDDTGTSDTTGDDAGSETTSEDLGDGSDATDDATAEDSAVTDEAGADTDVDTQVDDQNAAAEVTDETTGDTETSEDTSGDGAAAEGDAVATDEATAEVTEDEGPEVNKYAEVVDGEETETETTDVAADDTSTDEVSTDVAEDDDTPLEGAEDLGVDAEEDLTPAGGDMGDSDGTAATVEESITDGTSEDLQDGVDAVADATAEVEEDSGETTDGVVADEQPLAEGTSGDETGEGTADVAGDVVDEAPPVDADVSDTSDVEVAVDEAAGPDTDGGQVADDEETEADFDKGEVEVKDVDTTTTDEDVEEAMADAAEVGEWGDKEEKDAELADKTIEELQNEKESLEKFRVLLEDGIANESYSPGLLAYMNAETEPLRKRLAKLDDVLGTKTPAKVALESFSGKDMDLAYVATLESFRGMISRLTMLGSQLPQKIENWWSRALVDKVTSRADALDKQIDLCLIQLKDSSFTTGEVTGVRGYLATDETNLVKVVAADLGITTDIAVKGIKASEQLQTTVIKGVNDIISAGSEDEIGKALDGLAALKNIKSSFPNAAFDKGLLGGYKLEIREGSGSDRSEKIESLGHTGIPVGVKANKAGENTSYTLSKGDIANLLKMAKTYVGIARKLATTTGDRAVSLSTKIRTTRTRALPISAYSRVKGDEQGVDAAATAMKLLAQAHVDLYKFITKHCVEVADALCGVAKKASK